MVPVVGGEPLTAEDFTNLSNDQKTEIEENIRQIQSRAKTATATHQDGQELPDR